MADSSEASRRPVGPRLYHTKSRMGCLRCKQRRVKCDEVRPSCGGCSRHLVECVYPTTSPGGKSGQPQGQAQASGHGRQLRPAKSDSRSHHSHSPNSMVGDMLESSITPGSNESNVSSSPNTAGPSPPFVNPPTPAGMGQTPPVPNFYDTPSQTAYDEATQQAFKFQRELEESDDIIEIPESRERRMWELRLMHNFMLNQAQQFHSHNGKHAPQPAPTTSLPSNQTSTQENGAFLWGREIPYLAFEDDGMLYSMMAHSALNLWTKATDQAERDTLRVLQQKYLGLALREQRKSVATLSRENADRVCMSSLTMLSHSFALVQTLPVTPWEPPLEWLRMGKGAGALFTVARGYLGGSSQSDRFTRFLNSKPKFDPDEMFTPENRAHLMWLLDNDGGSVDDVGGIEMDDPVTRIIYHRVLSYIGTVQKATHDQEPLFSMCRRFAGFAVWMPDLYHEFLTQRRPRALVALAHFFALWIPYSDIWLVGKTGENQVRGIYGVLPLQWRHKLDPLFAEYNLDYDL